MNYTQPTGDELIHLTLRTQWNVVWWLCLLGLISLGNFELTNVGLLQKFER